MLPVVKWFACVIVFGMASMFAIFIFLDREIAPVVWLIPFTLEVAVAAFVIYLALFV